MDTSLSMLDGIRRGDPQQWQRFVKLFGPLVYDWCRRNAIRDQDAADITQNVFKIVAEKVERFRREQSGDSFHGWLFGITRIECQNHFRQKSKEEVVVGGSTFQQRVNEKPDFEIADLTETELSTDRKKLFDRALRMIETDFEPQTWQAFWHLAINGRSAKDIADELGMTQGAVYNAKYKVLNRLRTEFAGTIPLTENGAS